MDLWPLCLLYFYEMSSCRSSWQNFWLVFILILQLDEPECLLTFFFLMFVAKWDRPLIFDRGSWLLFGKNWKQENRERIDTAAELWRWWICWGGESFFRTGSWAKRQKQTWGKDGSERVLLKEWFIVGSKSHSPIFIEDRLSWGPTFGSRCPSVNERPYVDLTDVAMQWCNLVANFVAPSGGQICK